MPDYIKISENHHSACLLVYKEMMGRGRDKA